MLSITLLESYNEIVYWGKWAVRHYEQHGNF